MKRNTLFSFLTVAALGLLTAGPANAGTFTWVGSNNANGDDWRVAANWDLNSSYPQTGDIAIIANVATKDPVIDQQNEVVSELRVSPSGLLTVTGKKLTLDGTTTHDIDGDVVLSNAMAMLAFTDNVTVDGDGSIVGQDDSARVFITAGKTLTNEMIFEGNMKLLSTSTATDANFVNGATGTVLANGDGGGSVAVLLFAAGLDIDDADTGTPKWQATSDTDAQLRFDVSDTGLDGEFTISGCATLYLDDGVDIYTTGDLVATANDYNIRTDSSATYCFKYLFGGGDQVDVCGNISCP